MNYQVEFFGQTLPGFDLDQVKQNLTRLLKLDAAKLEPLFSGRKTILKRNIDKATADKYQQALAQAGAQVNIVEQILLDAAPQTVAAAAPIAQPILVVSDLLAPVGAAVADPAPKPAPFQTDLSQLTAAAVGADVADEQEKPPAFELDLGDVSLAAVGADVMDSYAKPPAFEVDLSQLSVAEVGAAVADPVKKPPPFEADLSDMSLVDS